MKTLADAWNWYEATKRNLGRMQRLGRKHWNDLPWEGDIGQDDAFRMLEASDIIKETSESLKPIDDLAVVVLFSVFESRVRDFLVERVQTEATGLVDPILREAARDALQGIEEGSFYRRVLQPLKEQQHIPPEMVTRIDQVRDYRNWVAHGRRERNIDVNNITPRMAYNRLVEFLEALGIPEEPEVLRSTDLGKEPL